MAVGFKWTDSQPKPTNMGPFSTIFIDFDGLTLLPEGPRTLRDALQFPNTLVLRTGTAKALGNANIGWNLLLPGKYFHGNAQAVAQAHEFLRFLMFAATCVCPYSGDAYGTGYCRTAKLEDHHRQDSQA